MQTQDEDIAGEVIQANNPHMQHSVTARVGTRFGVHPNNLLVALRSTAFKMDEGRIPTDAEMVQLLIVADQYKLNPFTRELYAFVGKNGTVVPIVSVDGWARIINEHPQFDGMDFAYDAEWVECTIHRKDRAHPTSVREFQAECARTTGPWKSHPKRMLRHKALIQCARVAFGFAGIYDEDEGERIIEAATIPTEKTSNRATAGALERLENLRKDFVIDMSEKIKTAFTDGDMSLAHTLYEEVTDADEKVALQHLLPDSKMRKTLKDHEVAHNRAREIAQPQEIAKLNG